MPKKVVSKSNNISKRKPRSLSNYNIFMRSYVLKVKKDNPYLTHREAFKKAAQEWQVSSENPKNATTSKTVNNDKGS